MVSSRSGLAPKQLASNEPFGRNTGSGELDPLVACSSIDDYLHREASPMQTGKVFDGQLSQRCLSGSMQLK